jgi:SlyX protein
VNEDRMVDIETKIAYQEDLLQALNRIVSEQQKQIDQLELTCNALTARVRDLVDAGGSSNTQDEKPPHY